MCLRAYTCLHPVVSVLYSFVKSRRCSPREGLCLVIFLFLTIFCLHDFLIGLDLDGVVLDETVTSFSHWDPVQFSLQWPELVEMDRVLL